MVDPDRDVRELDPVLALARQAAALPADSEDAKAGRARIVARAAEVSSERRLGVRTAVLLASAALGLAALGAVVFQRTRHLQYDVIGAEGSATVGYVGARPDAPAEVRFSDGSRLSAAPGARVRVEETERQGARILVEKGALSASVQHRAESNWRFGAGPYEVRVTGTKFRLAWDPERAEIDLRLDEGSVEVESPMGPKRVEVRAGQRFHSSAREGFVHVENVAPAVSAPPASAVAAPSAEPTAAGVLPREAEPSSPDESRPRAASPVAAQPHDEPWPELARRGQFGAVVAQAKARGVDACLTSSSAADLRALADAARYGGDAILAERSLEALRTRFAGSTNGRAAAFLLGRTHESRGDLTGAGRWYRVYLKESPSSELAADALAGLMRVASSASRRAEAKALAEEYLGKYPNGVDAGLARKLAGPD
jgi:TolA-binding protein